MNDSKIIKLVENADKLVIQLEHFTDEEQLEFAKSDLFDDFLVTSIKLHGEIDKLIRLQAKK